MPKEKTFPVKKRNSQFRSDHLDWKVLFLSWCKWEKPCVCLVAWWLTLRPVASVSANIPFKKNQLHMTTTNFGLITHQNDIHFDASFGRRECSLIFQKDISLLQSSHMKPKNKVEVPKKVLSSSFLSPFYL